MGDKIRVLVVDDSQCKRDAISAILNSDPLIEVVGVAENGKVALEKTLQLKPRVVTLDLNMPVMDGNEFIVRVMGVTPVSIIVLSGVHESEKTMKALSTGAMDFISLSQGIEDIRAEITSKVKTAAKVKPIRRVNFKIHPARLNPVVGTETKTTKIIAIGSSTGGPQALQEVLSALPENLPSGVIIVQHMTKGYVQGLVEWLAQTLKVAIKVAQEGDVPAKGTVLVAPDDYNLKIDSLGKIALVTDSTRKMLHVPSITVMMQSVAEAYGPESIGVIMTGMGSDGAEGIKAIKKAGGVTIAQDEGSSAVFGMNKVAVESGYVDDVVPLEKIAEKIMEHLK